MAKYRVVDGKHARRDADGVLRIYGPGARDGEIMEISHDAAARMGSRVIPVTEQEAAAPSGEQDERVDADTARHPLHALTSDEGQQLVAAAGTLDVLESLRRAEENHPKHPGGRVGVMRAIARRKKELAEE